MYVNLFHRQERGVTATALFGVGMGLLALVAAGLRGSTSRPKATS